MKEVKQKRISVKEADAAWRDYKKGQTALKRLDRYTRLNAAMKEDRTRFEAMVTSSLTTLNRFFTQFDEKHGQILGGPQTKPIGFIEDIMVMNLHSGHSATVHAHRRRDTDVPVFEAVVPKGWSLIPSDELFDLRMLEHVIETTGPRL